MKDRAWSIALAVALAATAALATIGLNPPPVVPSSAPADQFSAERGFGHIQAIAREPHPSGSKAIIEVRRYIQEQLSGQGLNVTTQAFDFNYRGTGVVRGVNIVGHIPGLKPMRTNAVLLACHYDSVSSGPGASDDGSGIATLLETARALKAGPALQNDVLFLFTDGEEADLDGARTFVQSPVAKEVGIVLNFDARGVSGPVFMFETSAENGSLIDEFGKAVPYPSANSLMYEVYRKMPNDTDLTIFKKAGLKGLNFGFIGGPEHYHRATDDPAHFSVRTLQHAGSYALSLARRFGDLGLPFTPHEDAVYFDILGRGFVHYSGTFAKLLTALACLFYGVAVWLAMRRRDLKLLPLLISAAAWAVYFVVIGVTFRAWQAPWWAAVVLTTALGIAFFVLCRIRISAESLSVGGLLWWAALTVLLTLTVPGAAYVALWPLVSGIWGLLLPRRIRAFAAVPVLVLAFPLVRQFYVALGPGALFIPVLILGLILAALSLQIDQIVHGFRKTTPA